VSQKVHARSNNEIGSLQYRTWSRTLGRQKGGSDGKGQESSDGEVAAALPTVQAECTNVESAGLSSVTVETHDV
jgi:hypothetical protein